MSVGAAPTEKKDKIKTTNYYKCNTYIVKSSRYVIFVLQQSLPPSVSFLVMAMYIYFKVYYSQCI